MARRLRYLSRAGALVEVSTRTLQGRPLLKPSDELNEMIVGVMGRALESHPSIKLHFISHKDNQISLLLSVPDAGDLATFMCFVNGNIARLAGELQDWPEKFWGRRYRCVEILDDEAAVERLRHLAAVSFSPSVVAQEGAVAGVNGVLALKTGAPLHGRWRDRTGAYEARRRGVSVAPDDMTTEYEVRLAPLPAWEHRNVEEQVTLGRAIVAALECKHAPETPPCDDPTPSDEGGSSDPDAADDEDCRVVCYAATRELHERFARDYAAFVTRFRAAARRHCRRRPRDAFPSGCFPPAQAFLGLSTSAAARAPG